MSRDKNHSISVEPHTGLGNDCSCCGSKLNPLFRVELCNLRGTAPFVNALRICTACARELSFKLATAIR